eukprot:1998640-Lingulodinium_polyedra.AAC.1
MKVFLDFFAGTIRQLQWQRAARHELGGGLGAGADVTVPARMLASLRKKGEHRRAGLLLSIVAGG